MKIEQFEDKNLAHFSYAITSKGEMALIDPSRNPQPYYDLAKSQGARITAVIETHPHADFVSSHLEIHQTTGATIYVSKLVGAEYPHQPFDEGDSILLGNSSLKALNTPGHSPDSISIVAIDQTGTPKAVFTGDTLFLGDCGRPDLRESAGAITANRIELAKQMYHSLREKLMQLPDDVVVYPAHGAGSLCGKGLSHNKTGSIGEEKFGNWSLQKMTEKEFVDLLLVDQPFIPKYFPFDVALNKKGATSFSHAISAVKREGQITSEDEVRLLQEHLTIIDTRPQAEFKKSFIKNAINLMDDTKFETWLGSIISPGEPFYLIGKSNGELDILISRIAKIGYEEQIVAAFSTIYGNSQLPLLNGIDLHKAEDEFTIVDIRNPSEVALKHVFGRSLNIPLYELRERAKEIPIDKPLLVHCAGGYRSAAGSSILRAVIPSGTQVYDLGEKVKELIK